MQYSFVLLELLLIVNGYVYNNQDQYYFELILQVLWRYPIIKQALIHRCNLELEKCKDYRIFRSYTNHINDDDLQERLDYLIDCFIDSQICRENNNWQQWSEWSVCSVTCGMGRRIRTRSCKRNRQCLIDSYSSQYNYCFTNSCIHNNYTNKRHIITQSINYRLRKNNYNIILILILIFPFFFTIICIPLCVFYYIYECDFKIHSLIIQIFSRCNRYYEIK